MCEVGHWDHWKGALQEREEPLWLGFEYFSTKKFKKLILFFSTKIPIQCPLVSLHLTRREIIDLVLSLGKVLTVSANIYL